MHQLLPLSVRHPTMERRKPSIEFIHSFYSGERDLFSRMVSSLEIDGDLAFKIISYWLWLEENINKDVIHHLQSLSDDGLKRISSLGEKVLINAARSDASTAEKARLGVDYFLKAVCYKAIDDLKNKAEYEKAKKALQELDLEEFLCKPDPSLAKSRLSSGDGGSSASSGTHMQSNNNSLSSIPVSSSARVYVSQSGNYSGGNNSAVNSLVQPHDDQFSHGSSSSRDTGIERILVQPNQDRVLNSSQLSATARAYYPSHTSRAGRSDLPRAISANNFRAPVVEPMIDSNAIVPHIPALSPRSGAIIPFQTRTNVLQSDSNAIVPQLPALSPRSGAIIPFQTGTSVFQSDSNAIVPHIPALSPRSGSAIIPFLTGANVFQSLSGSPAMIINARNLMQQAPVLVPPRWLHPDERTLFVTFSNGSPLTADELIEFFTKQYCNDVESIYIEEPSVTRPPQYAHVTFYHVETVELVLNGVAKVKFRTNGKHLWARRFIPRRRRRWGQSGN